MNEYYKIKEENKKFAEKFRNKKANLSVVPIDNSAHKRSASLSSEIFHNKKVNETFREFYVKKNNHPLNLFESNVLLLEDEQVSAHYKNIYTTCREKHELNKFREIKNMDLKYLNKLTNIVNHKLTIKKEDDEVIRKFIPSYTLKEEEDKIRNEFNLKLKNLKNSFIDENPEVDKAGLTLHSLKLKSFSKFKKNYSLNNSTLLTKACFQHSSLGNKDSLDLPQKLMNKIDNENLFDRENKFDNTNINDLISRSESLLSKGDDSTTVKDITVMEIPNETKYVINVSRITDNSKKKIQPRSILSDLKSQVVPTHHNVSNTNLRLGDIGRSNAKIKKNKTCLNPISQSDNTLIDVSDKFHKNFSINQSSSKIGLKVSNLKAISIKKPLSKIKHKPHESMFSPPHIKVSWGFEGIKSNDIDLNRNSQIIQGITRRNKNLSNTQYIKHEELSSRIETLNKIYEKINLEEEFKIEQLLGCFSDNLKIFSENNGNSYVKDNDPYSTIKWIREMKNKIKYCDLNEKYQKSCEESGLMGDGILKNINSIK